MINKGGRYVFLPIEKIIPYEFNNKDHVDYDINEIIKSIKKVGFRDPLEIDENNVLLSGHGRLLAARKLGIEELPVIIYHDMTEKQKTAYRLLANKIADLSMYNILNIKHDLDILDDPELNELFKDIGISIEPEGLDIDNEDVVPIPQDNKPLVREGDVFQLGNHILLCGDATKKESYHTLLKGDIVDIVFTDPPYNINYKGSGKKTSKGIKNDNMGQTEFYNFLYTSFTHILDNSKNITPMYIFHSHKTQKTFEQALNDNGADVLYQLIRNKPSVNHVGGDYKQKHEPFFYCCRKGYNPKFYGDIYDTTVLDLHSEKTDEQLLKEIKKAREAENEGKMTIRSMNRHNVQDYVHPTQKPVGLVTYVLQNSSQVGDIVLDSFGGSGTTVIACEKVGRRCHMMELDPKYIEVIIVRYREFTRGRKEIKCLNRKLNINDVLKNV